MDDPSRPSDAETPARPGKPEPGTGGSAGAPSGSSERPHRFADTNFASAIYGQLLVLSLLGAVGGRHPDAITVLTTVLGSQIVFWVGHAYAEIIAKQVESGKPHGLRDISKALQHEWPLIQATFPTVVLMVLALADVLKTQTALDIAIAVGIVQLLGWGYLVGRRSGRTLAGQILVAVLSGFFGLVVVLLKIAIH